jgi:hypothetical protein
VTLYLLGVLTLPALYALGVLARDTARLWRSVRRYGGEDVRVLTLGGRVTQRLLQAVARLAKLRPERSTS